MLDNGPYLSPWDVLSLVTFCPWDVLSCDVMSWDVLYVHRKFSHMQRAMYAIVSSAKFSNSVDRPRYLA